MYLYGDKTGWIGPVWKPERLAVDNRKKSKERAVLGREAMCREREMIHSSITSFASKWRNLFRDASSSQRLGDSRKTQKAKERRLASVAWKEKIEPRQRFRQIDSRLCV